jgi:dUTP pyrophosphatase
VWLILIKIKIYKELEDAKIPERGNPNDAGLDLFAYNTITIQPGERELVPIGVRIITPKGYYYTFAPRSSLAFKENVIPSHHNVMDPEYSGSCAVLMLNRGTFPYTIEKGDRFCQVILHKIPKIEIEVIDGIELDKINREVSRGERGFGSTDN